MIQDDFYFISAFMEIEYHKGNIEQRTVRELKHARNYFKTLTEAQSCLKKIREIL